MKLTKIFIALAIMGGSLASCSDSHMEDVNTDDTK